MSVQRGAQGRPVSRAVPNCWSRRSTVVLDSVTISRIEFGTMSRPTDRELDTLHHIADELVESIGARGHRIGQALALDDAFGSGSRRSLLRDLVTDAVATAVGRAGQAEFRPVNGQGRELRFLLDTDRRYRLRRGRWNSRGELVVQVSSASALAVDEDEFSLWPFEQWALVWAAGDDCQITDVVAAYVQDVTEGRPGRMVFGDQFRLGTSSPTPSPARFVGDGDELDGFLDDFLDEGDEDERPGEASA